ncbi:aminotransferase class I/II-fold pyridoxal phosphate-dependent enzyme [Oceanobacillus piezotolerans]|uniref:aminotransferase class I/II-fold pyridoxal phosphate-dependent enzyme n=1 Tax=Oceanobacillus piezotolerans TaxID=2448030 RepID=UPI00268022B7
MYVSNKIKNLPEYVFSEFQRQKEALQEKGIDVIDLGIGAPDLPTPSFIYDVLAQEAKKQASHRYSPFNGSYEFRSAVADFYKKQFDVDLDPDTEVLTLIGSKEGIVHFIQAVINEGDKVIIPDPGYPAYQMGVQLAGGQNVLLPLDTNKGFVPRYDLLSEADKKQAKLMFLNYPNNPTASTVEINTYKEAISFVKKHKIILAHDAAYQLVTFGEYKSPSVLQVQDAKKYAVEFGSLSKSFNMTGWRIGYVVGNKEMIQALANLKSNIDTSQFLPIQKAAAAAMRSDLKAVAENNLIFQSRMEKLQKALEELGIESEKPKGSIFIWAKVPVGYSSSSFANKLLEEAGIMVTPGTAFGLGGEGYIRISLSVAEERLDEVIRRLRRLSSKEAP